MIQLSNINISSNGGAAIVNLCIKSIEGSVTPLKNAVSHIIDFRLDKNELRREMSVTEFANEARISRQAVVKMISSGKVRAQMIGEQYIINAEELVRYLKAK